VELSFWSIRSHLARHDVAGDMHAMDCNGDCLDAQELGLLLILSGPAALEERKLLLPYWATSAHQS